MLTSRRNIELPHYGLSPQYEQGHPSRDPNVILVPERERVKIEWRLVPCVICVELPGLMHDFQSCFCSKPRFVHDIGRHCKFAAITLHRPL